MSREDALRIWKQIFDQKQNAQKMRFGLTGDGSNAVTSDVDGRYGWAWIRYDEEPSKVSQVRNRSFPGIVQDVPVIVGKRWPSDKSVEILGINWPLYEMHADKETVISYLVAPHGDSHHAVFGSDPAYMDIRNMLPGRARETDPASLGIYVESFGYASDGTREQFPGGGLDFTYDYPGTANHHRYALAYLDTEDGELKRRLGPVSPVAVPPTEPSIPSYCIPIALVQLVFGDATIVEGRINDYRILWTGTGPSKARDNIHQVLYFQELYQVMHAQGEM
jgi:hypothetical protein